MMQVDAVLEEAVQALPFELPFQQVDRIEYMNEQRRAAQVGAVWREQFSVAGVVWREQCGVAGTHGDAGRVPAV